MKHFEINKPVIRGRASVIHSELTLSFLSKEQCDLFLKEYLENEQSPYFTLETIVGDSLIPDKFELTLHDIAWASNLIRIAQILDKYDYNNV